MNRLICLLVLLSLSGLANASNDDYRKTFLQSIEGSDFNGSVLLSKKGVIVLHENIGFADRDKKVKLQAQHLFSPGSVGKEFTTISLMQLVEQGKLSYQDNITKFIDELPVGASSVTIEQILTHTSGFPKIKWKKGIDTPTVIKQIKKSKLKFQSGNGYLYSNLNVVLRALIVEKVTGEPYSKFIKKFIFDIASMSDSHHQTTQGNENINKVYGDYPTYLAGVTFYVTPLDLLKFEHALWAGKLVDVNELKRVLVGDKHSGKKNRAYYDFGSFLKDKSRQLNSWEHDGSNPSHHTLKYHDFINEYTIVLMSSDGNKSTLYEIRSELRNLIFRTLRTKKLINLTDSTVEN